MLFEGLKIMDRKAYADMSKFADAHWWYVGRRELLRLILKRTNGVNFRYLEIGCGTGNNFPLISNFGEYLGIDNSSEAINYCKLKYKGHESKFQLCEIQDFVEKNQRKFDAICMFDVLEHLENPEINLEHAFSLLKPGGYLLVTVPAYQWLWSEHDEIHHHLRRYSVNDLKREIEQAKFSINMIGNFNFILLPVVVVVRVLNKILQNNSMNSSKPINILNYLLTKLLVIDAKLSFLIKIKFGLSIWLIGRSIEKSKI